jgi:hypothetical protein
MATSEAADGDRSVERPDDDDYDLLTYGEAAARLAEEINAERHRLDELIARQDGPQREIDALCRRIQLLVDSDSRYRRNQQTADKFAKAFGVFPRFGGRT